MKYADPPLFSEVSQSFDLFIFNHSIDENRTFAVLTPELTTVKWMQANFGFGTARPMKVGREPPVE
jgi:hypothetical protein